MTQTKKAATKKAAKPASKKVTDANAALTEVKISLPAIQKLLKAGAKTLASVPGRRKVMVLNPGGSLKVVKKNGSTFSVIVSTTDVKEAVAAYNKIK